ncbi:MAG TPA: hypothetical protein VKR55_23350 [Bradyrhizobium sp.]|uniref:hypothetical protein n=1 Tax=Bradyrhizobium sp. TaxID=376 RepID=UPI002C0A99D7|nr:hypothetical protein [Bradyrhizobium sp.]HLZ05075.1 hypothetical protein [Bradyrhizobium sp.]
MLSAALYARVRTSLAIAHETAGAARTRHSLRPPTAEGEAIWKISRATCGENADLYLFVEN